MKDPVIGILQFAGSNCEWDCVEVMRRLFPIEIELIWYKQTCLPKLAGVIIPGGFSFGDYLRSGAIAARMPIMRNVYEFANRGGAVLGICNGFQILTECGMLPGVLLKNSSGKFICRDEHLIFERGQSVYQQTLGGQELCLPIAHGEGRYFLDESDLSRLEERQGVVCRYSDDNPNGSVGKIAGVCSENGKVFGLMPHPERAASALLGSGGASGMDGVALLQAFLASFL